MSAMKFQIISKWCFKSEGGFVLIPALMAVMIMMAVGFFALTVTSQDIRISSRMVGDRKALSAAESGLHWLTVSINPLNPSVVAVSNQQVDPTEDPSVRFSIAAPTVSQITPTISQPGNSEYEQRVFDTRVTGRDTHYDSSVILEVGIGTGNYPKDTGYR